MEFVLPLRGEITYVNNETQTKGITRYSSPRVSREMIVSTHNEQTSAADKEPFTRRERERATTLSTAVKLATDAPATNMQSEQSNVS